MGYRKRLFDAALRDLEASIVRRARGGTRVLDVGCGNASLTRILARDPDAALTVGVDLEFYHGADWRVPSGAQAREGVELVRGDLEKGLPFSTGSFDVVVSNQVIEHMKNPDHFAREVVRVLAPGGRAVVGTENLASWHNVAALALGFDPFSISFSSEVRSGNPLSDTAGVPQAFAPDIHWRVPTVASLVAVFERAGLRDCRPFGTGYHPLPPFLARPVSRLLPRHAGFIGVEGRKPA